MQRRLAVGGEHRIGLRAVIEQPAGAVRFLGPVQDLVERRTAIGGPWMIHVRAVRVQQFERSEIAAARGQRQRHAVARIGAGFEQRPGERQRSHHTQRTPEHRPPHAVMQPREARVGVRAERDQTARDGNEAGLARRGCAAHRRVTDVMQRLPAARPAGRGGERRLRGQPNGDRRGVTKQERRIEA